MVADGFEFVMGLMARVEVMGAEGAEGVVATGALEAGAEATGDLTTGTGAAGALSATSF